jgi:hypothetical protein
VNVCVRTKFFVCPSYSFFGFFSPNLHLTITTTMSVDHQVLTARIHDAYETLAEQWAEFCMHMEHSSIETYTGPLTLNTISQEVLLQQQNDLFGQERQENRIIIGLLQDGGPEAMASAELRMFYHDIQRTDLERGRPTLMIDGAHALPVCLTSYAHIKLRFLEEQVPLRLTVISAETDVFKDHLTSKLPGLCSTREDVNATIIYTSGLVRVMDIETKELNFLDCIELPNMKTLSEKYGRKEIMARIKRRQDVFMEELMARACRPQRLAQIDVMNENEIRYLW